MPATGPPSLAEVVTAIQGTGIALCDLGQVGTMVERVYGKSTDGRCGTTDVSGVVRIWSGSPSVIQDNLLFAVNEGEVWMNDAIMVSDPSPSADEVAALAQLGLTSPNAPPSD